MNPFKFLSFTNRLKISANLNDWLILAQESISPSPDSSVPSTTTLDFWGSPVWQSIGVIISTLLAVLALWLTRKQFQKKSFSYDVISVENIVKVANASIGSDLQILYKGVPIKNLYLVTIKFRNSGNTEIKIEDYARPVSLYFDKNAKILGSTILEQNPKNLGLQTQIDSTQTTLITEPILLNKKDSFTLQLFITDFKNLNVEGRIAGVKEISRKAERDSEVFTGLTLLLGIIAGSLAAFILIQVEFIAFIFLAVLWALGSFSWIKTGSIFGVWKK